jgi:hypothetical protein
LVALGTLRSLAAPPLRDRCRRGWLPRPHFLLQRLPVETLTFVFSMTPWLPACIPASQPLHPFGPPAARHDHLPTRGKRTTRRMAQYRHPPFAIGLRPKLQFACVLLRAPVFVLSGEAVSTSASPVCRSGGLLRGFPGSRPALQTLLCFLAVSRGSPTTQVDHQQTRWPGNTSSTGRGDRQTGQLQRYRGTGALAEDFPRPGPSLPDLDPMTYEQNKAPVSQVPTQ